MAPHPPPPSAAPAEKGEKRPVVRAAKVTKKYGAKAILDGVDFQLRPGDFMAILGRSGSGKSTLIHVLAGLDRPTQGSVWVEDAQLSALDAEDAAEFRLRRIGIVFQHFNLIPDLTILENVTLPLQLAHAPRKERDARGRELLALFGIADLAARFPEGLSGGELQRVAVARALANRPGVVLADEPTANLDEENTRGVIEALQTAARAEAAVLVVSHDPLVAAAAGRKARLNHGRLEAAS